MVTTRTKPVSTDVPAKAVKTAAKKAVSAKPVVVSPPATKPVVKPAAKATVKAATKTAPKAVVKAAAPAARKPAAKKAATPVVVHPDPAEVHLKVSTAAKPQLTLEQRHHYVAVAAFYIAERRGFTLGNPAEDWLAAEAEVDRLLASGHFPA